MYLVDLDSAVTNAESFDELENDTAGLWSYIFDQMDKSQSLWIFAPNLYTDSGNWPTALQLAESIRSEAPFTLRNILTLHRLQSGDGPFTPSYEEILFLVKDKRDYKFNKDDIRVENVYEGKEWHGLREEGQSAYRGGVTKRYNPDGKDPGNVWMSEHRDHTAGQVVDETSPFSEPRKVAADRCVRAATDIKDTVSTVWASTEILESIKVGEREVKQLLSEGESVNDLK